MGLSEKFLNWFAAFADQLHGTFEWSHDFLGTIDAQSAAYRRMHVMWLYRSLRGFNTVFVG